jgi:hypothetical protein
MRLPGAIKLRHIIRKTTPLALRQALTSNLILDRASALPEGVEMTTAPWLKEMACLVKSVEPPDTMRHLRDEDYFDWRYRCPLSSYQFFYAKAHGRLTGFMVLQKRPAYPRGRNIVDWDVENVSVFQILLKAAISVTGVDDLNIWSASIPSSIKSVLSQNGFHTAPHRQDGGYQRGLLARETGMEGRGSGSPLEPFTRAKAWNLRMIFSDDY